MYHPTFDYYPTMDAQIIPMIRKAPKMGKKFISVIAKAVADKYEISTKIIDKVCRERDVVLPRQIVHKLAHEFTSCTLFVIGSEVGGKCHATVLNSCKAINNLIDTEKNFKEIYNSLYYELNAKALEMSCTQKVCVHCGSYNLITKIFVNLNTMKIINQPDISDDPEIICVDCNRVTKAVTKLEYDLLNVETS